MRVTFAYFLMLCIMTMNIWLIVAVITGACVGYGVGKPIVANGIHDAVTSHGYDTATLSFSRARKNSKRTERSMSWRYQPVNMINTRLTSKMGPDSVFDDGGESDQVILHKYSVNKKNTAYTDINKSEHTDVKPTGNSDEIWLKRPPNEAGQSQSAQDLSHVQYHGSGDDSASPGDTDTVQSEGRQASRFRSTSKVINESFRSVKGNNGLSRQSSSSSTIRIIEASPKRERSQQTYVPSEDNRVARSVSTVSARRFKPVSQQIRKQMSFNEPELLHVRSQYRQTDRV